MVGPWCFLDRFGPLTFGAGKPMDVAPHPHIGLQTVSWLLDGEIVHDDSLGFEAVLRPGGVNVMTAGAGIAHAEQTPRHNSGRLNGVQLWVALPDQHRHIAASFAHVAEVPSIESPGGIVQVFAGRIDTSASPAPAFSSLVGAELRVHPRRTLALPLDPGVRARPPVTGRRLRARGRAPERGPPLLPGNQANRGRDHERGRRARAARRRPAVPRTDRDVVELRRPDARGDLAGAAGLGGAATLRRGARLPTARASAHPS